ncbi:hypothetical protein [Enterococcus sp. LJL51]|uniref:hypothetical protein n=1 Tax=Enterococcus sp. LJL51 TaxID=3416656 RepID=UPI003CF80590
MKSGNYGIYHENEYEIIGDMDGNTLLLTENKGIIDDSFEDTYNSGVYTKKIEKSELSEYYSIELMAKYKEFEFYLRPNEKNGNYVIGTSLADIAEEYGFLRTDKYFYEKEVPKSEVEVRKIRKQLQ